MKAFYVYSAISYLIGSIPSGVILSKLFGFTDPRKAGSGNIGATNVYRVGGRLPALLTLLMDVAKGYLPAWIFSALSGSLMVGFMSGFFAFLGHLFPIYLGFKGGKGVATALGVFLYVSPATILILFFVFIAAFLSKGIVSVGSMVSSVLLPFAVLVVEKDWRLFLGAVPFSILILVKHIPNIKRLREGTEKRVFKGIFG